jgi:PKHD-type hydroxylase
MITNLTLKLSEFGQHIHPYVYWDGYFTEQELEKIQEYCNTFDLEESTIISNNTDTVDKSIRKSKVQFLNIDENSSWIFEKIKTISEVLNNEFFRFDLVGFDYLQYTVYSRPGDMYEYHTDSLFQELNIHSQHGLQRKLSFSLILSDSDEYTGGDFEIFHGHNLSIDQLKGRIIAYPSFMLNKIHPIKIGKRRSIDWWVLGPKFK